MNLYHSGQRGEGWGWGVCNLNLCRALEAIGVSITPPEKADVVFQPLGPNFLPTTGESAKVNIGYTFFEEPLTYEAVINAKRYDLIFAGSTWCLNQMPAAGITNASLLIQGVDYGVFKPGPRVSDLGRVRVFSGGKFEYRKGQDLVIAAFKRFAEEVPNAHLVASWHNPWPQLIMQMGEQTDVIKWQASGETQMEFFYSLLIHNGLRSDQFTILPQLPQANLACEMCNTDFGLFPNRCEGGTNLVLMEYLACGKRAVANMRTGHADLQFANIRVIESKVDEKGWAVQEVDDIVSAMKFRTTGFGVLPEQRWTWEQAARIVKYEAERLLASKAAAC